jgi:murein DD-endopeptidase MepM/ murein hydrolase activator NlpD
MRVPSDDRTTSRDRRRRTRVAAACIAVLALLCIARADAQEPSPTPSPLPTETPTPTPPPAEPTPTPTATATPEELVTPAPVESGAPPPVAPTATATPTVAVPAPTADRGSPRSRRPNIERHKGSVGSSTPTPTPTAAPRAAAIPPVSLGAAAVAVPNFFIDKFRIPPFLLPIYQAAGIQFGIRWEVLAGINEIETDYGRNVNISSAGALGWMQFMPSTWKQYGVDANRDGVKDPFNPVDAIFAAARYLKAAGGDKDLRRAIFAYNHADWYVDSVVMRAQAVGGIPSDLVGSLTGLTQGRFPVRGRSTYDVRGRGVDVHARAGAPVIAVADGRLVKRGHSRRLGRFVQLRDVYGNTYTYAHFSLLARERRHVLAGSVLGRIDSTSPHLHFEIRPAGRGAPRIEPKPILDGWRLLESSAIYRPRLRSPFLGGDALAPSVGEIMLMSKDALAQRVLADRRIHVYACGRRDVETGQVDRRVLATLEFLAASGLEPTVSSLRCGHGYLTASGNVSEHSSGNAVDIAAINGVPILGHQGEGSVTELTIRRLLTLQGAMKPHQLISLMTFDGADNTFAMADHADHIHVGFRPQPGPGARSGADLAAVLKPQQWIDLSERLGVIDNPAVARRPSKYALGTHR